MHGTPIKENVWACCTELKISRFINDNDQNCRRVNKSHRKILVSKFYVTSYTIRAVEFLMVDMINLFIEQCMDI